MEIRGIALVFLFLFSLLFLVASFRQRSRANPKKRLPPGPLAFPFVGSIHHMLTSQPQAALGHLADKHGPVMHLQLGQINAVVISSPAAAQEILQANDLSFAARPNLIAPEIVFYGNLDLGFSPYGDYWRALRKLCTLELFSARKVKQLAPIRDGETMSLVAEIRRLSTAGAGGKAVNIGKLLESCTNTITALAIFGDGCSRECKEEFLSTFGVVLSHSSGFFLADLFPSLWLVDIVTGMRHRVWRVHRQIDELLNKIIAECEERWKERKAKNGGGEDDAMGDEDYLLSHMLKVRDEANPTFHFSNANIKAVLLDVFIGGTDTISSAAEWVMTELIRHPEQMSKVQEEVREAFNNIEPHRHESSLDRLHYTRMVIKETFRLHPTVPLSLRLCRKTCDIGGYEVTKGSYVVINNWAIARSPQHWDDAEEFKPMRFENSMADYKGTDYSYMPFGSGRRMCAGMGFALVNLELIVARLLYYFDWRLPAKMLPEELNMETVIGATAKRRHQLHLCATPYDVPVNNI